MTIKKHIGYILLISAFSLNAQNMVIDCTETIITAHFKSVSDTLKGYNGLVMLQSKSGLKINYAEDVTFIHGFLAREKESDYRKPFMYIGNCNGKVKVSSRIILQVGDKNCKVKIIEQ